jgi:Kef-type K+ transport system membrane component KefB
MPHPTLGSLAFFLLSALLLAHGLGWLFVRMRQPRVIGEILAGVIMGPTLLGQIWYGSFPLEKGALPLPLELCYQLGLLLLMFLSGAEIRKIFRREDRKETVILTLFGTGMPFIAALLFIWSMDLRALQGERGAGLPLMLVIGIAVAVTSIPVISKIFFDLKILHTRFAKLVLGVAVLEDIGLWAVLAIATALANNAATPTSYIAKEVAITLAYFALGLGIAPRILKYVHKARFNVLGAQSPEAYLLVMTLAYVGLAAYLNVNLVFAAFLAGLAVPKKNYKEREYREAVHSISRFAFAFFIPLYFALVGYKLDLQKSFSLSILLVFMGAGCAIKLASVLIGARAAGFKGLDAVNLAIATNARGGPGIVLASVALEAQIISPVFYTTLILLAIFTSQAAGAWLEYVLRSGKPLLSSDVGPQPALMPEPAKVPPVAA